MKKLDTIVGSVDPVAADAYATTLFGLEPHQIKSTMEAYQRGLGQMDLTNTHALAGTTKNERVMRCEI
ncbi:MAG: hypothetical protein H8D87_16825 [Deltaproteobacteria bacterium]|uniref:hypothetical protein n=1 Tax=Desulfobacula sp. TaxID=2593537 RepID=UPI0019A5175C|nr:hypothetical protein [Candidatus Desulfobacula maris]MBL6992947.1 hypothetical protein [Desulfobacula sp.]